MKRQILTLAPLVLAVLFFPRLGIAQDVVDCSIFFDGHGAIANIYNEAKDTFADWTHFQSASSNQLDVCDPSADPSITNPNVQCWQYQENCGEYGRMRIWSIYDGHYHLDFTDPSINCVVSDNVLGFYFAHDGSIPNHIAGTDFPLESAAKCPPLDWAAQPRSLATHDGADWLEISNRYRSDNSIYQTFDFKGLDIGSTPIQMWFRYASDGSVWGWDYIDPNQYFDVSGQMDGIVAVWIGLPEGQDQEQSIQISDFIAYAPF